MVALGFMAAGESYRPGQERERKREREREREREGEGWKRGKGLYSRGMNYTPPAVSNTLFIGRLFIISVSCARNCTISGGDRLSSVRTIVIGLIDIVGSEVGRKSLATNCSLSPSLSLSFLRII